MNLKPSVRFGAARFTVFADKTKAADSLSRFSAALLRSHWRLKRGDFRRKQGQVQVFRIEAGKVLA